MPHSSFIAAEARERQGERRDGASSDRVIDRELEKLAARQRDDLARDAERQRLAADVMIAAATVGSTGAGAPRRVWGIDGRLFTADLRRMHRERQPG